MSKRFDKLLLAVAIVLIATCAIFAFVFSFDSVSETAYAATQHAETFGNDNHGDNHAGTKITLDYLRTHWVNEDGNYALGSGQYYLGSDLTLDRMLYFTGTVNFCLNGYKLTAKEGAVITIDDGYTASMNEHPTHTYCRIFDCHSSSCNVSAHLKHTFTNPIDNKSMTLDGGLITGGVGGGIRIYSGILYMYNGTIAGNSSYYSGGGVSVTVGEFRTYGTTTIAYNKAGWTGGGVSMGDNTKFLMKGGTIRDNAVPMDVTYSRGGGVYLARGARFEMSAGTINNNSSIRGGGVYFVGSTGGDNPAHVLLSGTAQVYDNKDEGKGEPVNIRGEDSGTVEVGGTFLTGANVMLSSNTSKLKIAGYVPTGQKMAPYEIFSDEAGNKTLSYNKNSEQLEWLDSHTHGATVFKPLTAEMIGAYSYVLPEGNYYLTDFVGVVNTLKLSAGTQLCFNCKSIYNFTGGSGTYALELRDDCVLTNCKNGGGRQIINEYSPVQDKIVRIDNQGGYLFCSSSTSNKKPGIIVRGKATMDGYDNGNVTIFGGFAENGGGVYVESGTFTIIKGKITDCLAEDSGGGVYAASGANLNLKGGEISNNEANVDGGGVYVEEGNVTGESSCKITGNRANYDGGGMALYGGGGDLAKLEISNNTAKNDGGGLYMPMGEITGGIIKENKTEDSGSFGGGVFIMEGSIKDSVIQNNTCNGFGGGLYILDGVIDGVQLLNNTAKIGGGLWVEGGAGTLEFGGNTVIRGNKATDNGGGIFALEADIVVKQLTLENNSTEDKVPEFYMQGGTVKVEGSLSVTHSDGGKDIIKGVYVSGDIGGGTLTIENADALNSLANSNLSVTLDSANSKVVLASSLKADSTSPTGKIQVGYSKGDVTGTLVSKQSAECDVDVSQYFEYVPFDDENIPFDEEKYCVTETKDVVETHPTHSLIIDVGGVKFNDDESDSFNPKYTMTCSLKCERCGEEVPNITVDYTRSEEVLRPSCTQRGVFRYYYALTTQQIVDSLSDSLGYDARYYSVTSEYSTSREIASLETPAGHEWKIEKRGPLADAIVATCLNPAHDEERDGCKQTMTIQYNGLVAHAGTSGPMYDGKPYELNISDPDGFRENVPGFRQEILYDDPLSSDIGLKTVSEIKNAGEYTVAVYTAASEYSVIIVDIKVRKAPLNFALNKSESTYSGNDVDGIEVILDRLAIGDTLVKNTDYKITFNGKDALPKDVGTYSVGIELLKTSLANNYTCSDHWNFVVNKAKLEKPTGQASQEFVYNGSTQAMTIDGFDAKLMKASVTDEAKFENGLFSAKDFKDGGYQLVISVSDDKNYEWREGGDPTFTLTIKKAALTFSVPQNDVYTSEAKDLLGTIRGAGDDVLTKGTDYVVKYDGKDDLPVVAKTYVVTVELKAESALANNYTCSASQNYTVANAKLTENESFAPYKSGKQQIYDPLKSTSLDFPSFGADGFPFTTVGGQTASVQYILQTYEWDGGHADAEAIGSYLDDLKKGEHASEWQSSAGTAQDPKSYCVYFKIEAQYHDAYFGYYIFNIYGALYTITLSDKDLSELSGKFYGDKTITAEELEAALKAKTDSIIASAEGLSGEDIKDTLFADDNFVVYLVKDGARYLGDSYEVGEYSVHASYVDDKSGGGNDKYITFAWKLKDAEGDGRPTFEVGKRALTFELAGKANRPYQGAAFGDIDVTFTGCQNGEALVKGVDYVLKFNDGDTLPFAATTYAVKAVLSDTELASNYTVETESKDFTVDKATLNFAVPVDTVFYNGREVALFATLKGEGNDLLVRGTDYIVKYNGNEQLPLAAGSYRVTIEMLTNTTANNYKPADEKTFEIHKAQIAKPNADNDKLSAQYNGGDHIMSISGYVSERMTASATAGSTFNSLTGQFSARNFHDGGYTLSISISDKTNYEWTGGGDASVTFTINISKATLTFSVPTTDAYTGAAFDILSTLRGEGNDVLTKGRDYAVKFDDGDDLPVAAKTYAVTVELKETSLANNYTCDGSQQYVIAKAKLARPTADGSATLTYNGAAQSLRIRGFVDAYMASEADEGSSFNTATGAFSAKNVKDGGYALTISLKDDANYEWAEVGENEIKFTLTITKATLNFEVPSGGAYDGRARSLLATIGGEGNDLLVRGVDYDVTYNGEAALPLAAGAYTVKVLLKDSELANNYACSAQREYAIAKAQLAKPTAKADVPSTYVYNGESQYMEIEGFDGVLMTAVAAAGSSFGASTGRFAARNVKAGGYELVVSLVDKANYTWQDGGQDDVKFTLTLTKASLDFELVSGESYDPLGHDILRSIQGEARDVLKKDLDYNVKCNDSLDIPKNVGVYGVEVELLGTDLANNYLLTATTKTYTITRKQLAKPTIASASLTYNGQPQFARVSGFDYDTMTADVEEFAGDRLNATDAGSHSVVISIADKSNYQWEDGTDGDVTLTFAIARATLTFETAGTSVFDGDEKAAEIKFGGLLGDDFLILGEDFAVKYNGTSTLPVNAGNYAVTVELLDTIYANNYVVSTASQTFVVEKARLTKLLPQQFSAEMNGKTKLFDIKGYDKTLYVLSGGNVKDGKLSVKKEGHYDVTVSIFDKTNFMWDDGTSDDLIITMTVVDPRPIGYEETVAMATAIPVGTVSLAGAALGIALRIRRKRKLLNLGGDDPA